MGNNLEKRPRGFPTMPSVDKELMNTCIRWIRDATFLMLACAHFLSPVASRQAYHRVCGSMMLGIWLIVFHLHRYWTVSTKLCTELKSSDNSACTLWVRKKLHTILFSIILPNVHWFINSFTIRLSSKLVIKSFLNIPPHLKHVATLYIVKYMGTTAATKEDVTAKCCAQSAVSQSLMVSVCDSVCLNWSTAVRYLLIIKSN